MISAHSQTLCLCSWPYREHELNGCLTFTLVDTSDGSHLVHMCGYFFRQAGCMSVYLTIVCVCICMQSSQGELLQPTSKLYSPFALLIPTFPVFPALQMSLLVPIADVKMTCIQFMSDCLFLQHYSLTFNEAL